MKPHVANVPHNNVAFLDKLSLNMEERTTPATSNLAISSKKSPVFMFNSFLVIISMFLLNVTKVIIITIKNKLPAVILPAILNTIHSLIINHYSSIFNLQNSKLPSIDYFGLRRCARRN